MNQGQNDNHWLTRPQTVRKLWIGFAIVLTSIVVLEFFIEVPGSFGFGAWYGFAVCVAMVLAARILAWLLKRPEDYYQPSQEDRLTENDKHD